ncbi:uncharacterized protein LAJ45_07952 [Morchella importuna]|uniref:uncharacterized protein n=1 Tax=Morchella importuna TaxID=1174673 RepID=UPI001E8D690B|nr:uncharacterized protein LAJ45_07952 [Morchella importuna]KAH8147851.1 hypothetical protein LAJ45_07952 [Morchella importuna]
MYRKDGGESTASTLLRYFSRPRDTVFQDLTYIQYYEKWILYSKSSTTFKDTDFLEEICNSYPQFIVRARRRNEAIARIDTVSPRTGELFYLRALLLHGSAYCFEDLKIVNQITYSTFQEAAAALGLFENQSEGKEIMAEAVQSFCSPNQLRFLFAHLLMNIPVAAIELFEEYQEALSADYLDQYDSPIMVMNKCLEGIARHLAAQGSRLTDFGLPQSQNLTDEISIETLAFDHRSIELTEIAILSREQLLPQQMDAFDTIMNNIDKIAIGEIPEHTCFFLDGKAGRVKTYVVNTIVNYLRGQGDIVFITGSTALSVTLYERGRTAHSAFGILVVEVKLSYEKVLVKTVIDITILE